LADFVLDKRKKPLMPCSEKRARLLFTRGRAVVHPRHSLTIPLKDRVTIPLKDRVVGEVQPVRIKVDPGGKTTHAWRPAFSPGPKPGLQGGSDD
jgi:hypothetical protein